MVKKIRIDQLLVERGMVESRNQAQRLVMAGQVRVDGQVVPKSSTKYPLQASVTIDQGSRFVSRGGEKLQAAIENFHLDVKGKTCADVGASTGGFTDCLLQHGANKVYAIDVGKGLLHWKLRQDSRVQIMEETNARYVTELPEAVSFVSIDVSFISLKVILPVVRGWFSPESREEANTGQERDVVALVKPQFEAGRSAVARGKGVIRDSAIHHTVLMDVLSFALDNGFKLKGLCRSPVLGPKGNVEFFAWMAPSEGQEKGELAIEALISEVVLVE